MPKKKKGLGRVWLLILFMVLGFVDDIPGMGGASMFIFRAAIIGYSFRGKLFGEKGLFKGGVSQWGERLQEAAMKKTEEYIKTHPDDTNKAQLVKQIEAFKEKKAKKEKKERQKGNVQKHMVAGNTNVVHTYKQPSPTYTGSTNKTKDALTKTTNNPYSLDGR